MSLLDFYTIKWGAVASTGEKSTGEDKVEWKRIPKPLGGWFVPLQVGYKAISPIYKPGEVMYARDRTVPFRFVEPVYTLGEWIGLHRINDDIPETIFWRYHHDNDMYLCVNEYTK